LACSIISFHFFLSCVVCFQLLTPIFLKSFLTSSSYLTLGLPFGLVAYGFHYIWSWPLFHWSFFLHAPTSLIVGIPKILHKIRECSEYCYRKSMSAVFCFINYRVSQESVLSRIDRDLLNQEIYWHKICLLWQHKQASVCNAVCYCYKNNYQNVRKCNLSLSLCEDLKREWEIPVCKEGEWLQLIECGSESIGRMQRVCVAENSSVCTTTIEVYTCDVIPCNT
jgi:hypothetical protein